MLLVLSPHKYLSRYFSRLKMNSGLANQDLVKYKSVTSGFLIPIVLIMCGICFQAPPVLSISHMLLPSLKLTPELVITQHLLRL